mmetsp:Transcript_39553/g.128009  ORF Transcript_39553/g.128009 Transcript_39553/m.128009 type:complete len:89 (-) Transcript_39553:95-361(-)
MLHAPSKVRDTLKVWLVVSSALPVPDLWSAASAALKDGRCAAAAPPPCALAEQSESSEPLALLGRCTPRDTRRLVGSFEHSGSAMLGG